MLYYVSTIYKFTSETNRFVCSIIRFVWHIVYYIIRINIHSGIMYRENTLYYNGWDTFAKLWTFILCLCGIKYNNMSA